MINVISNLKRGIIDDIKIKDKTLIYVLIFCAILTVSILVSFWVPVFSIITCVLSCICMLLIKGVKKIYILIYLLPFYHVIKINPDGFVLCSVTLICAIFLLGIEYVLNLIKKKKNIDWKVSILFASLAVFVVLPIGPFKLMHTLKLLSTLAILYLVYVNKEELNFKSLVTFLTIGFLIACSFAPLRNISDRLEMFLPDFPAYIGKQKRFSGLTSDPNYFAVEVLLLLGCLTQLYFAKIIKVIYYPIMIILSIIGLLTISKAYLLSFMVFAMISLIALIVKKIKNKEKVLIELISFIIIVAVSTFVCLPQLSSIFGRFDNSYVNLGNNKFDMLNSFTTGRSDIWLLYIEEIFSSPKNILLGHGVGASLPLTSHGETAAHNLYLECLYHLGFIGVGLILSLIIYLFIKTSKKSNRIFFNFITFIVIAFILLSLNGLISYRTFIIAIIVSYSINLNDNNEEKGENCGESFDNNECV